MLWTSAHYNVFSTLQFTAVCMQRCCFSRGFCQKKGTSKLQDRRTSPWMSYPRLTLVKSKATCLYETAFSFRYRLYLRMNVDMSYPGGKKNGHASLTSYKMKVCRVRCWGYLAGHFCPRNYWGWIMCSSKQGTAQNAANGSGGVRVEGRYITKRY